MCDDNWQEQDTAKTSELFGALRELFKGRCEATMSIIEFPQSIERHGLLKTKSGGMIYIKNQVEELPR